MSNTSELVADAEKAVMEELERKRAQYVPKVLELTERLQVFSWTLTTYFCDLYLNFLPVKTLEQMNYYSLKAKANADYDGLRYEDETYSIKFPGHSLRVATVCEDMDIEMRKCMDLCTVVEGIDALTLARRDFARSNYIAANAAVKSVQRNIRRLNFKGSLELALQNLIVQTEHDLALISATLSEEWEKMFKWQEKKSYSTVTYSMSVQQNDPQELKKILKALYVTNRLHAELFAFSQSLMENLISKIVEKSCEIYTEDAVGALVFNVKVDMSEQERPPLNIVFNNLMAVFEFIESTLGSQFEEDVRLMEILGQTFADMFFHKIISECITCKIPRCKNRYNEIAGEVHMLNRFLIDLKFIGVDHSPLNNYLYDTDKFMYDKKCDQLLVIARELFSYHLANRVESAGTLNDSDDAVMKISQWEVIFDANNPIFLPKCIISRNVGEAVRLVVKFLKESISLPLEYRDQLFSYIKQLAVMYQTLVTKKYTKNLLNNAFEVALFFNNCYYLAHSLLGPPWTNILPEEMALKLNETLIDDIFDLKVAGLEILSVFLSTRIKNISKVIDGTELPWVPNSFDTFDRSVNCVMTMMRQLKESWYNILPMRMYEHAMCTLVKALNLSMVKTVLLDSNPVKESLIYMLALRFETTITAIQALFPEQIQLDGKVEGWVRFTLIPKLFRAQLLEVTELWNSNTKVSQAYTCEEIRQIIKMRFPDSHYRLKILIEIQ